MRNIPSSTAVLAAVPLPHKDFFKIGGRSKKKSIFARCASEKKNRAEEIFHENNRIF